LIGEGGLPEDVTTADHLAEEEPEPHLEGDSREDERLTDSQLAIRSALDRCEHLLRVGLNNMPFSLLGKSEFLGVDLLEESRSARPLGRLLTVESSSEIGKLLEESKTAG
ncbi:hypothetical protein PENTCL1PPCAC_24679, partial [Pristionchus entomophagus]